MDSLGSSINHSSFNEQAYTYAEKGELEKLKELVATDNASEIKQLNWNWQQGPHRLTALFVACMHGHELAVDYLLSQHTVDPNLAAANEHTPFLQACMSGNINVVRRMLQDPRINVNQFNRNGFTPFSMACGYGHVGIVGLLLTDDRVDINKANTQAQTPLYMAAWMGHLNVVKLILASGKDINIKHTSANNRTAAQQAKLMASLEKRPQESTEAYELRRVNCPIIAELLDEFEKDPVMVRRIINSETACNYAFNGELDKLQEMVLAEKPLDWNWPNGPQGLTAFFVACMAGHELVVDYLLSLDQVDPNLASTLGMTPFYRACFSGNIKIVQRLLLDPRINVNLPDANGETPFYRACVNGHVEVVKLLLEDARVDINQAENQVIPPFLAACQMGHLKVVELMLKNARLQINQLNAHGCNAFHAACQEGHEEVVKLLLEDARVDIDRASNEGWTPFFRACMSGHLNVVELLMKSGRIDINQPDDEGTSPFSIACQLGHLKVVQRLMLDPSVDVNQSDGDEATPFYVACMEGHVNIVRLLLTEGGVDINQRDNTDFPLFIAAEHGELEIVQRILLSGRDFDPTMMDINNNLTAAEHGREMGEREMLPEETQEHYDRARINGPKIADLLDEFERDPVLTRKKVTQLYAAELAASLFALVIFHTDGFMNFAEQPPLDAQDVQRYQRFLSIAKRLPMELQMMLCHRAYGGSKTIVPSKDSEGPFRNLAKNQLMWFPK